jgi:hypothetical protein
MSPVLAHRILAGSQRSYLFARRQRNLAAKPRVIPPNGINGLDMFCKTKLGDVATLRNRISQMYFIGTFAQALP